MLFRVPSLMKVYREGRQAILIGRYRGHQALVIVTDDDLHPREATPLEPAELLQPTGLALAIGHRQPQDLAMPVGVDGGHQQDTARSHRGRRSGRPRLSAQPMGTPRHAQHRPPGGRRPDTDGRPADPPHAVDGTRRPPDRAPCRGAGRREARAAAQSALTRGPEGRTRDVVDSPDLPAEGDDIDRVPDDLKGGRLVQTVGDDGEGPVPVDLHERARIRQRG